MDPYPYVVMPDPTRLLVDLIADSVVLPPSLAGKVVAELREDFPADLPWLAVQQVSGASPRPVRQRVGQAAFDVNVYAYRNDTAASLARQVTALIASLVNKSNDEGGVVWVDVTEPFPLPDVTTAHRWVIQVLISYRPI